MTTSVHTNLKLIDIRRKENEIRGGFTVDQRMGEFMGVTFRMPVKSTNSPFMTIDRCSVSLDELLNTLSAQLGLPKGGYEEYGLMYDKPNRNAEKTFTFVTENGLKSLKDGFLLIVTASPRNYAKKMFYKLQNIDLISNEWQATMETLYNLSLDYTFTSEFHQEDGIRAIAKILEQGLFDMNVAALCRLLCVFMELMRHPDLVDWSEMTPGFVQKVAGYVNGSAKFENNESLRLSLSILLTLLDKGGILANVVKKAVKFESLTRHLEKQEDRILLSVLTMMNLLHEKADEEDRFDILRHLHDRPFRVAVESVIIRELAKPDERINEQLVLIQEICYQQLRDLALRRPNTSEIEHITEMSDWDYNSPRSSTVSFENLSVSDRHSEPSVKGMAPTVKTKFADFVNLTPPGSLAVDAILDYSKRYKMRLLEIQAESNLRADVWPSIMAQLVNALVRILLIVPDEANEDQLPEVALRPWIIMFNADRPFHELFRVAMNLFARTWREMHANSDDEDKVLHVVRHQLARGIMENPASVTVLDDILQKKLTYFHMGKIWEKERIEREELELKSSAVRDLQQHLRPAIEELVKARKKNVLKDGFVFAKVGKGKSFNKTGQQWHWKLDNNERCLWYTECSVNPASTTSLCRADYKLDLKTKKKLLITDIKRIVTGSEYSETVVQQIGMKLSKKTSSLAFLKQGFSIEPKDQSESLTLATEDKNVLQAWIEGLNLLLGTEDLIEKRQFDSETDRLLDLEVRMRLLNLANPPAVPPPLPPMPNRFVWIPEKDGTVEKIGI